MKTSDFYYDLPQELIAQDPLEDRSSSRLLHLSMKDGSGAPSFYGYSGLSERGRLPGCHDTRVIPARLYGPRKKPGAYRDSSSETEGK